MARKQQIHVAAEMGLTKVMDAELTKGVNIDLSAGPTMAERTPLHYCAANGHLEACKWLVERKATVDKPDRSAQVCDRKCCATQ